MASMIRTISCVTVLCTFSSGGIAVRPVRAQATDAASRARSWEQHVRLEAESPFRDFGWRAVGPKQAGARVEAIAVPPGNHGTLYVGVGSGNLWKTTNNGLTWRPIFEKESAFSIGDVAVSASDPDVVWVGTGETQPRHSGYAYAGTGVFKSTDGGGSWQHMGLEDTHHIGKVLIHPDNSDVVWVAALGHFGSRNEQRGVFRTTDGGLSWDHVLHISDHTGVVDLVLDPSDPDILLAAAWQAVSGDPVERGDESGIYRSTDGGDTWTRLATGLPAGPLGRIGLDVAPSNPGVVYAFIDNGSAFTGQEPRQRREIVGGEVYRSDDKGLSWRRMNEDDLYDVFTVYGWKFMDIRVAPDNEDEIFILGNRVFHSKDGGRTYERIGETILRMHDTRGTVMHLDHHEIWIDPLNPDRILLGNDGGLFQSWDRGRSWLHVNNIPAAEFYSVSTDMATPYRIFGGTQDNAALYGPSHLALQDATDDPWENVYLDQWTGGDSFDTYLDPTDSTIVYYEHQHGAMRRMNITGDSVRSGGPDSESIQPRAPDGEDAWRFGWYTPFVISHYDPFTLYVGANRLLKSTNRGDDWQAISPDLSDPAGGPRAAVPFGTITSISESRLQRGLIYVGTEGGTVWRTTDEGQNWSRVGHGLPGRWVSRVVASEHTPGTVYVAQTGYRMDDFETYVHVSRDSGDTWESIAGNLPSEPVNVIREDPLVPGVLYVGTDFGVYVSVDGGGSWHSLCANLPTTPVHDLVIHRRDGEIVIGTHGRSVFVAGLEAVRAFALER